MASELLVNNPLHMPDRTNAIGADSHLAELLKNVKFAICIRKFKK